MKRKLVNVILVTMVCVSALITGCGNVSETKAEDIQIESQLYDAIQNKAKVNSTDSSEELIASDDSVDLESDYIPEEYAADVEMNQTFQSIADREKLDVDVVREIEEQFKPVSIAAEESWTEALNMSKEWKDLVHEMNQRISAKAVVKLVDINLNDSTATYKVITPDVISFLAENMNQASSVNELADQIKEALERDELTATERDITIPIHISGSEVNLDIDNSEVMDTITGGFYGIFDTIK